MTKSQRAEPVRPDRGQHLLAQAIKAGAEIAKVLLEELPEKEGKLIRALGGGALTAATAYAVGRSLLKFE